MDLMSLTAVELGKKIQAKEVTVEEAVKAAIASIKAKEEKKQNELKTLVSAFTDFYKQVYKVHDFSFSSIASENTKDTKKEVLTKGLNIVKNFK